MHPLPIQIDEVALRSALEPFLAVAGPLDADLDVDGLARSPHAMGIVALILEGT